MRETEELLAEQVAYYRARAPEYDDWWQRRRGYDLGEQATSAWRADAALLREALDGFAPRGQVLELAAGTGIWTGELLRHADRVLAVDAAPEALEINRAKHDGRHVDYVVDAAAPVRRRLLRVLAVACPGGALGAVLGAGRPGAGARRPGVVLRQRHPEHLITHGPHAYRGRADRLERAGERLQRRLQDGRAFQIVKRYWQPAELEAELAAVGWRAVVGNTPWAFIHGSATRAKEDHIEGFEPPAPQ